MKLLGFEVPFTKRVTSLANSVNDKRGWYRIFESYPGAWQQNVVLDRGQVIFHPTVYACLSLIASDIAKLPLQLVEKVGKVWVPVDSPSYSPVLRKPNKTQNRIQFIESWMMSKLERGNTYVLKERDARGIPRALWVLDPDRVTPLVTPNGDVYYQLDTDNISGLENVMIVPASEIIHDRINCLFHPLVGTSPLFAAAYAATTGLHISQNSSWFFANRSQPGGILSGPGEISDSTLDRLKEYWNDNFTGPANIGKVAIVGDGLTYSPLGMKATDAQLVEQLKYSSETICSVFHVPPYKVGIGQMPTYNNIQSLNVEYFSQCLHRHIEDIELCLDDGLGLTDTKNGKTYGTQFDETNLLRMDSKTQMEVLKLADGVLTINEKRERVNMPTTEGGDTVYLQQQNFSLSALAKRDAKEDPFGSKGEPVVEPEADNENERQAEKAMLAIVKGFRDV